MVWHQHLPFIDLSINITKIVVNNMAKIMDSRSHSYPDAPPPYSSLVTTISEPAFSYNSRARILPIPTLQQPTPLPSERPIAIPTTSSKIGSAYPRR
jgi:hypothetical protein